jgi:hypothetical protein
VVLESTALVVLGGGIPILIDIGSLRKQLLASSKLLSAPWLIKLNQDSLVTTIEWHGYTTSPASLTSLASGVKHTILLQRIYLSIASAALPTASIHRPETDGRLPKPPFRSLRIKLNYASAVMVHINAKRRWSRLWVTAWAKPGTYLHAHCISPWSGKTGKDRIGRSRPVLVA